MESALAAIENAKYATAFPSGTAAVTAIASIFSPGDHFVVSKDIYGGTMEYFLSRASRQGIIVEFADFNNEQELKNTLQGNTKLVWFETPTNPTMTIVDIKAVCEVARSVSKASI